MISSKLKHNERLEAKARLDKNLLRQRRALALKAFDIYKTNVYYLALFGEEEQEPEERARHELILDWYTDVLLIDEDPEIAAAALDNIPPEIAYYM